MVFNFLFLQSVIVSAGRKCKNMTSSIHHISFYILCIIINTLCTGFMATTLGYLPDEVLSHNIFSALSIKDKFHSLLVLNGAAYDHVFLYHNHEFQLVHRLAQQLDSYNSTSFDPNKVRNITQQLRLSESFASYLPTILDRINTFDAHNRGIILDAMDMQPITISQFTYLGRNTDLFHSEMDILILASRALIQYYLPESAFIANVTTIIHATLVPGFNAQVHVLDRYPWMSLQLEHTFEHHGHSFLMHWAVYMTYLYEITFDVEHINANIPSLNTIHKHHRLYQEEEMPLRRQLQHLIDVGLMLWSRNSIHQIRSDFFAIRCEYRFHHFILEAHRINKLLSAYRGSVSKHDAQYMTTFALDLVRKYNVSVKIKSSSKEQLRALSHALYILERYRFEHYSNGNSQFTRFLS
eukprot:1100315_1